MNENLPMGGLNPEELKVALEGVAHEYSEGVWALEYIAQLEADLKRRPSIKLSDGDVWLVFPNATISIEGIIQSGRPGPIVTRNLRKWREGILKKALGGDDD